MPTVSLVTQALLICFRIFLVDDKGMLNSAVDLGEGTGGPGHPTPYLGKKKGGRKKSWQGNQKLHPTPLFQGLDLPLEKLKGPSRPHLLFRLHGRIWLL